MSAVKRLGSFFVFSVALAFAHVGSPDVFFQGKAGPYPLLVTIRPPDVIPGVARVHVENTGGETVKIELSATPMTGDAAKHPPVADVVEPVDSTSKSFNGSVWLMGYGSWEVRVRATGPGGSGELLVPVSALAVKTAPMQTGMGYFLFGMMVFLTLGMVAIVGASIREARLEPGTPAHRWNARSIAWMGITAGLLCGLLWFGRNWWASDAETYSQRIYKPLILAGTLDGRQLEVQLKDPGWMEMRKLDDLIPDHGHLMHLFLVRWPAMDQVFHLHPEQQATGFFATPLPTLPSGTYRLYGDIVHDSGLAETAVGQVELPAVTGTPLSGDDAGGATPTATDSFALADGYRMVMRQQFAARATDVNLFSFAIVGPDGKETPLEPYMGMGGHAEFVKEDGSVFAHVHPTGSVSMASVAVASPEAMMAMHQTEIGSSVSFPYGVPSKGRYRIFVQLRRNGRVETGSFGLAVNE